MRSVDRNWDELIIKISKNKECPIHSVIIYQNEKPVRLHHCSTIEELEHHSLKFINRRINKLKLTTETDTVKKQERE